MTEPQQQQVCTDDTKMPQTREELLMYYFERFYKFVTEEALPNIPVHPQLTELKALPSIDLAYFLQKHLVPLKQELLECKIATETRNPNDIQPYKMAVNTLAMLEFAIQKLDPKIYKNPLENMKPEHIHKFILYLCCFYDILSS